MKRCTISLFIREMQINATLPYCRLANPKAQLHTILAQLHHGNILSGPGSENLNWYIHYGGQLANS